MGILTLKKFLKSCQARLLKKLRMIGTLKKSLRSCQATAAAGDAVRPPLGAAVLRGGDAVMSLPPRALEGGDAVRPPLRVLKGGDAVRPPLRVLKGGDAARSPPQRKPLRGGEDVRPAVTLTVNIC